MKSYESDEENVAAMIRGEKTYKESELNWGVEREREGSGQFQAQRGDGAKHAFPKKAPLSPTHARRRF